MSLTANKNYNNQLTGSNPNTWGIVLNSNFSIMDANLGGRVTVSVAGAANYNVTANQAQSLIHVLTGVLTGNIQYIFPSLGGMYQVINNTTGNFTVTATIVSGVGAGVVIPQSGSAFVFANPDVPNITGFNSSNYFSGGTTTGVAATQVLANPSPGNYTLAPGNLTSWKAGFTSAGAMTLNINGTGAIAAKIGSPAGLTDTIAGSIVAGCDYISLYDQAANAHVILNKELPGVGTIAALNIGTVIIDDGSGNATIGANTVTNAMRSQMATNTIKGNATGGTANEADLTVTQVTAMLNVMVGDSGAGGTKGLVPAPAAGDAAANKFLKADGTYAAPTATPPQIRSQPVTAAGSFTFTTASNITSSTVFKISLTGGGAGASNTSGGGAGGGACTGFAYVSGLAPSTGYSGSVGSGTSAGSGSSGGTTSITINGTTYSAVGGAPPSGASPGAGGASAPNCSVVIPGSQGSFYVSPGKFGLGGGTFWGQGPTATASATIYGCGGGPSDGTSGGGNGATGFVLIEWIA